MKQSLGTRLKALREAYGLSQDDFGAMIGVTNMAINRIESGKTETPQSATLKKIEGTFDTTKEWLMTGKGQMLPNGLKDLEAAKANETANPYRDYAIQRLEKEVEREENAAKTWQEKYDQLWEMFSQVTRANFPPPVRLTA